MSPEDPNNPGLNTKNPDLSSVPLPEPAPIKSPYAPVGGTLGDVADDIAKDDQTAKSENILPTAGIASDDSNQSATQNADSTTDAAKAPVAKKLKIPKKVIIFAAIGLLALILIIVLVVVILGASNSEPGSNGKTGSMFDTKSVFIPKNKKKESFALYNGENTGEFEYEIVSHFIDGYALVRKDGKFGIIDEKGQATVDFGKYDNIVEYGGLYGATKDDANELIDGQGRVIRKYTDEFNNYGEIEIADRAAYTVFKEGDKKYSVYSPRGEKLAIFESEGVPTISSTNTIDSTSTTAVFYSDGVYIYDDAGKEVRHLERKIAKKYLITDTSADRKTIVLSTVPGKVAISGKTEDVPDEIQNMAYIIPNDGRYNAAIINDEIKEYDNSICSILVYETHYSTNDRGYLACLSSTIKAGMYIDEKGELTQYKTNTKSIYNDDIFPLSTGNYVLKENANDYGLYSDGKKVTSFKTSAEDKIITSYTIKKSFANNYIVLKSVVDQSSAPFKYQYDVFLYDEKGDKVCSFDESYYLAHDTYSEQKLLSGSSIGFNRSGIGINKLQDGGDLALVNDKCQRISDQAFYAKGGRSFWGDYLALYKDSSNHVYIDKNGKTLTSLKNREYAAPYFDRISGYGQWEKFGVLEAETSYGTARMGDAELLYYGKKTGIPVGTTSLKNNEIVDTGTCLLVRAVVGQKIKKVQNGAFSWDTPFDIVEIRAVNNNGEVIYESKEEIEHKY